MSHVAVPGNRDTGVRSVRPAVSSTLPGKWCNVASRARVIHLVTTHSSAPWSWPGPAVGGGRLGGQQGRVPFASGLTLPMARSFVPFPSSVFGLTPGAFLPARATGMVPVLGGRLCPRRRPEGFACVISARCHRHRPAGGCCRGPLFRGEGRRLRGEGALVGGLSQARACPAGKPLGCCSLTSLMT